MLIMVNITWFVCVYHMICNNRQNTIARHYCYVLTSLKWSLKVLKYFAFSNVVNQVSLRHTRWKWWVRDDTLSISGRRVPDSNVHGANTGLTWVLSAPGGPHVGPINLAIRVCFRWITDQWLNSSSIYIMTSIAVTEIKSFCFWIVP